ncbi:hypothetical protein BH11PSE4_BH11PSE4_25500 [soil metagenome]
MDELHRVLTTLRTERKSQRDHLGVFREFLAHLDALQRRVLERPQAKPQRKVKG